MPWFFGGFLTNKTPEFPIVCLTHVMSTLSLADAFPPLALQSSIAAFLRLQSSGLRDHNCRVIYLFWSLPPTISGALNFMVMSPLCFSTQNTNSSRPHKNCVENYLTWKLSPLKSLKRSRYLLSWRLNFKFKKCPIFSNLARQAISSLIDLWTWTNLLIGEFRPA